MAWIPGFAFWIWSGSWLLKERRCRPVHEENAEAFGTIEDLERENDDLQAQNDQLESANDELQQENDGLQAQNNQLESANDELQRENEDHQQTIEFLDDTINQQTSGIHNYELTMARQEQEIERLNRTVATLDAALQYAREHRDFVNTKFAEKILALSEDLNDFKRVRFFKIIDDQEKEKAKKQTEKTLNVFLSKISFIFSVTALHTLEAAFKFSEHTIMACLVGVRD